MSGALVAVDAATNDIRLATTRMADLAASVAAGDYDERLDEARTWVKGVSALLKARAEAAEAQVAAMRLEATILRQIAKLHRDGDLPQYDRATARLLARLSDAEFGSLLADIVASRSIHPLTREFVGRVERDSRVRARQSPGAKVEALRNYYQDRQDETAAAATELLTELVSHGEPFTTADAAQRLGRALGVDVADQVTKRGLIDLVERALRSDGGDGQLVEIDGEWHEIPWVVTYMDDGWVRVPWQSASVGQLHAMATARKGQAQALADAVRRLERLADAIGEPDETMLISEAITRRDSRVCVA